jgi:Icc-related predicted phosphoesterase
VGTAFFVSDLHGRIGRYEALFTAIAAERPGAVFLGGDLLPHPLARRETPEHGAGDFVPDCIGRGLERLRGDLGAAYPRVFLIFGNDDPRSEEDDVRALEARGLLEHVHGRRVEWGRFPVYGYACVPPTPFMLKDWERYDVSRYVEPGCVSPEEGIRTVPVPASEIRNATIAADLERLAGEADLTGAVFLFHAPPYETPLDRAALDGRMVDHAPVDVHVGSIAVRRFIEARRPALTLHGHIHESVALTGSWKTQIGSTLCIGGAHDGPELALVRFDPGRPVEAVRELI